MITVSEAIVETLIEAGVERFYGIVGDTANHITDAIRRSSANWVHVRHEEVAAMAAGGESLMTGGLAACCGTAGPGSLHFINGVFESHRNRAPIVLVATQVDTAEMGLDFPQEVDLRPIYKTCSHFCEYIHHPDQARRIAAIAAQTAMAERGAAVLIVPGDISKLEVKDATPFKAHRFSPVMRPSEDELAAMAEAINDARKVTIYAGSGSEGSHDQIVALAKKLNAPVAHTSRAKDFIEYDNPHNVGMTGILGVESGLHAVENCDLLLMLGADFAWRQYYPEDAKIIQVDIKPAHIGRRKPVDIGVVGTVKDTVEALFPILEQKGGDSFLSECLNHRKKSEDALADREKPGSDLIHPQHLTEVIDRLADDDAIFTADGGSPMVWMLRHIHVNGKRRTLTSLTHGTMANAMPQALGIKKALPDRQVIALSGDGGLTMLLGDLLTAVQEDIPLKIVVFNNGSLGFVEMEQKVEGMLDAFTELQNPDFAELAKVIGFHGEHVEAETELEPAVKRFLAADKPALLDVKVNRMELVMPPEIKIGQVAGTALYSAKAIMSGRTKDVLTLLESNFLK